MNFKQQNDRIFVEGPAPRVRQWAAGWTVERAPRDANQRAGGDRPKTLGAYGLLVGNRRVSGAWR